ncbi:MAG: hypothetical protein KC535_04465 [Nanoarchaeota archaeon]|nr:hypothetical protein [Nanoarchaeota archaeon]
MDIISSIEHRMGLLGQSHKEMEDEDKEQRWNTEKLESKISSELQVLKSETQSLLQECEKIHRTIFHLGAKLKEKLVKQELEEFDKLVQDWSLEEFITRKELEPTFDRYAKSQH